MMQRDPGAMGELDGLIGRTISGRYRVHRLIGQGGMGKVFEAQQIPLGRSIALKVLGASDPGSMQAEGEAEFQKRFFHEAAILARLKSPHTVTVFDYGRDDDLYFIAMELIDGEPLDRLLRTRGALPPAEAVGLALQICRSLREAHAQGVVHRDLKPANVLVTLSDDGEEHVKVLDFGLAKRLHGSTEDTNPNVVPGSPKYMAPEAIRQETVDGRADIYALGVILYQMLTGSVPFDAESHMDILVAHLQQTPESISARVGPGKVPPALEALVMRCLAKTPAERFTGMSELIEAFRGASRALGLGGEATGGLSLPPAPAPGRAPEPLPSLRLDPAREVTPSGTRVRSAPGRPSSGGWLLPVSVLALLTALGGGAYVYATRGGALLQQLWGDAPAPAPMVAEPASESQPESEPEPGVPAEPDMVIEPEPESEPQPKAAAKESEPLPKVMIEARSVPTGALVIIRGQRMGRTPITFEWESEHAAQGKLLTARLRLEGHEPAVVRQRIEGEDLVVDAVLEPEADVSAARDALRALEARAEELSQPQESAPSEAVAPVEPPAEATEPAPGPVLEIRPSEGEEDQ
ncbi:MAG: serine/threonine-protein kinase [Myxococcales bacterium]